jgi:hypothetical protein
VLAHDPHHAFASSGSRLSASRGRPCW